MIFLEKNDFEWAYQSLPNIKIDHLDKFNKEEDKAYREILKDFYDLVYIALREMKNK